VTVTAKLAVNDIGPHDPPKVPFLYWASEGNDCARRLFARYPSLQRLASLHPKDVLMKRYSRAIKDAALNEKNAQIRLVRELFVCNDFPEFQLVQNVMASDEHNGPMQLVPALQECFKDVAQLRAYILGSKMYLQFPLYELWSKALESGKLRNQDERNATPLPDMLTIAHEAHFRCIVAWTISRQSYRQGLGVKAANQRTAEFQATCEAVAKDREKHADGAWQTRADMLGDEAENGSGSDGEGMVGGVTFDSRFY
jgi:hypothetical protein